MKSTHKKEIEQQVSGIIAGIRRREPILENPEGLTDDIMLAIRDNTNANPATNTEKPAKSAVLTIMIRLTAAASVCLFLLFGYEEYILVDKITRLEKQNAAISQSSDYRKSLQLKKVMSFLASDPEMLNRYKEIKSRKIYYSTFSPLNAILRKFDSTHHSVKK
jgi:hypothetical protein